MAEHIKDFQKLNIRVIDILEEHRIDVLIGALKDNIQHEVHLSEPDSLDKAIRVARKVQTKIMATRNFTTLLTMLDSPTFRGSPWYEVPIIPHTIWCRSPIQYNGSVSIYLEIFLSSFCSTHESVMLVSSKSEMSMPGECVM